MHEQNESLVVRTPSIKYSGFLRNFTLLFVQRERNSVSRFMLIDCLCKMQCFAWIIGFIHFSMAQIMFPTEKPEIKVRKNVEKSFHPLKFSSIFSCLLRKAARTALTFVVEIFPNIPWKILNRFSTIQKNYKIPQKL